jgi:hypothetical protein
MQNSQLVVEGVEVVEVVEGVEVVEVVEVVEGVEEWLNLLFFIFHSSFVLAVPLSPVPCPSSLAVFYKEPLTLFQTAYFERDKTTGKSNDMVWT